ncbi:hypothetical protein ABB37_03896 [Leptomonas pyrrhocoris]|uniref:tRNA ligase phosphodiesterase domain-containing protein n=1 Tax=Leptomonas pyrrhocoris TaxID=157538 RepID=A0A0N0VFM0_LEPPY|nr:hypothetical protein ABB37_03896 [Leptomonas pyrrhocoris]KPA81552.1 hypothetical protein ABB37_03896 [Leptomonas pyrrhocoris]|eukprot:XP_015659991.1 hypothetical protein ABB37_03896 [Leptomonas pyrrhocoris]
MSFLALNVCLISSGFDTVALPLSSTLCPVDPDDDLEEGSFGYTLAPLTEKRSRKNYGYAHCTVVQLCVRALDLKTVRELVRDTWVKFRERMTEAKETLVLDGIADGPTFAKTDDGLTVRLPNIKVERSPELMWLHETLVRELEPFHVKVASNDVAKRSFNTKFPADSNTTTSDWLLSFLSKSSHENYVPHISLGACTMENVAALSYLQRTEVPWRECRLVVSHMGNYCSCFDLME